MSCSEISIPAIPGALQHAGRRLPRGGGISAGFVSRGMAPDLPPDRDCRPGVAVFCVETRIAGVSHGRGVRLVPRSVLCSLSPPTGGVVAPAGTPERR
jgi:hypothetical protein